MGTNLIKFEFDDNIYYIAKNGIADEHFFLLSEDEATKVANAYFAATPYNNLDEDALLEYVRMSCRMGVFNRTLEAFTYGLSKYSRYSFGKDAIATITSGYRNMGQPRKAIDFALVYVDDMSLRSVPLLTSLAAAYCDIGNLESARRYCNIAYALQGGGTGYKTELSLVYARIKKMENERL